jgi:hypothetical protein
MAQKALLTAERKQNQDQGPDDPETSIILMSGAILML